MVVYVGMNKTGCKSECTEDFSIKSSKISNSTYNFGGKTEMDSTQYLVQNSRRAYRIKSGLDQAQKIGLHLKTNVHIKQKKGWDYRDFTTPVLFCLLIGHVILTNLQAQNLRMELEVTKKQVEGLLSTSELWEEIHQKLKEIEKLSNKDNVQTNDIHILNKRDVDQQTTGHNYTNSSRQARSVGRGKHSHCKNRNGCRCRCYETSGPFAIHLRGALPEITVRDGGIVAPWYIDKISSGIFVLADGVVGEGKGIVEIVEEGLYFIYAQMYYLTSSSLNSYAINLQLGEGRGREDMVIAACSAEAATNKLSELSCFTAVVRYLQRGDRIFITQRERNRRIIFRDNKSFLGLTLLNSPHRYAH